jgi:S-adenosylmethionine:tRNA ribosyltransferase-isomerase
VTAATPVSSFDYDLPEAAIAQVPAEPRSSARLLVVADGALEHRVVSDLPRYLRPGDVLVVNETRVIPARLHLRKATSGAVEVLLLSPDTSETSDRPAASARSDTPDTAESAGDPDTPTAAGGSPERGRRRFEALVRPGRRVPEGTLLYPPEPGAAALLQVGGRAGDADNAAGVRLVEILDEAALARHGSIALPPYVHEPLADPDRYQTVFASSPGSVAAPTAGLHLTSELLAGCRAAGATIARVDLAVGLGTFRPIATETVEEHRIHSERYRVPAETLAACRTARAGGGRVVAVGTTTLRALETVAAGGPTEGSTRLYIHGDFRFRLVDVLLTNFHLPRSSLLVLLEAFAGPGWRDWYAAALAAGYRFLSFGDSMLVPRRDRVGAR